MSEIIPENHEYRKALTIRDSLRGKFHKASQSAYTKESLQEFESAEEQERSAWLDNTLGSPNGSDSERFAKAEKQRQEAQAKFLAQVGESFELELQFLRPFLERLQAAEFVVRVTEVEIDAFLFLGRDRDLPFYGMDPDELRLTFEE